MDTTGIPEHLKDSWILTLNGRRYWPLCPRPEDVCLEEIAHALSYTVRYNRQIRTPYSVAQHAVLMSRALPEEYKWLKPAALHHDDHEAYLPDVPNPVKACLPLFAVYEKANDKAIATALGLNVEDFYHPVVRHYDKVLYRTEMRDLMPPLPEGVTNAHSDIPCLPEKIECWTPEEARQAFLEEAAKVSATVSTN